MYIKLTSDKDLVITRPSAIYQGECNTTVANFVIPNTIGAIDCSACVVNMHYVLPDDTYGNKPLEIPADTEGETTSGYITSYLNIDSDITTLSGDVRIWLTLVNNDVILKSGETIIEIRESYIPEIADSPLDDSTNEEDGIPDGDGSLETEGE